MLVMSSQVLYAIHSVLHNVFPNAGHIFNFIFVSPFKFLGAEMAYFFDFIHNCMSEIKNFSYLLL